MDVLVEPLNQNLPMLSTSELEKWGPDVFDRTSLVRGLHEGSFEHRFLTDLRDWLHCTNKNTVIKETTLLPKLDWLQRYLPDMFYIFLFRKPEDVISSLLSNSFFELWGYRDKFMRHLASFTDFADTINSKTMSDIEISAYIWRLNSECMLSFSEKNRDKTTFVSYSSLSADPSEILESLLLRLGVDLDDGITLEIVEKCSETRGGPFSTYRKRDAKSVNQFSPLQMEQIHSLCSDTYERLMECTL